MLYQAYKDQYPNQKLVIGIAHYPGGSIYEHVEFAQKDEPVYRYYKSATGKWKMENDYKLSTILKDRSWNIVLYQAAKIDLDDETLNLEGRRTLEAYVDEALEQPHKTIWHTTWPSPNDEQLFSPEWPKQPPENYKEKLIKRYGFDPVNQYTFMVETAKAHILGDKTYDKAICTGTAVMHAYLSGACTQLDLWRDYTHLTDFGRLMVAYSLVTQLREKPLKSIGIDTIPRRLRHKQYRDLGNMTVTQEQKEIIIRSVNYALEHPYSIPTQA